MRHVLISPWSRGRAFGLSGVKYKKSKRPFANRRALRATEFVRVYVQVSEKVVMPITELEKSY